MVCAEFDRRRLAGTHHAVDVEQRVFARHVLVDVQRVADVGADIDVVDVEHRQFLVALLVEHLERLLGDLLAGLGVDFAGLRIDEVLGEVVADQFLIGQAQRLEALFRQLARRAHGELLAGLEHDLAGVGVDQIVDRLVAAEAGGVERHAPAVLGALVADLLVEGVRIVSPSRPSANISEVTGILRRRSMRAYTMSLASNSMSSQEPRYGMMRAANSSLPDEWVLPLS